MAGPMDPLTDDQLILLDIVWSVFHEHGRFPHFFYVDYRMRQEDLDATKTLRSFPAVGQHIVANGYRAVHWISIGTTPDPNTPVSVTAAGLYHVNNYMDATQRADDLIYGLLAFMSEITTQRYKILDSPFEQPGVEVNLREVEMLRNKDGSFFNRLALIAAREWPGINFHSHNFTGSLGQLHKADFATLEDYLTAVTTALAPPAPPPPAMTFTEPRALLRALNHLDVTSELVLGHPLVKRPPMDRSSLLALDVDDEDGYNNGLAVLVDLLRDLNVPGKNPPQGHKRLPRYLTAELPSIDGVAVDQAVNLLDQIRVIRNAVIHPDPGPGLPAAHRALGLPWPVRDFPAAWDTVRARAQQAVHTVQEAIQATRP